MDVNVVFVGHVDHGKSTLIGRLLYDSESIKEEKVEEIQKLVEEYKRRFEFAYFLDSFEEEIKEERTIDTVSLYFKSHKRHYIITDVPGHKEFIKNMLTGASYADVAVLVVSAVEGVEEQTRRHLFLLNMLGIRDVIVVVNKMDAVGYEKGRFEAVKQAVSDILSSLGYDVHTIHFIPVSAMEGDNIYRESERMEWYKGKGPTLIEALDAVEHVSEEKKPLRFVVQDIYEVDSEEVVVGRVESGVLRKGKDLVFEPSGVKCKVEKIKVFGGEIEEAVAGDSVGIVVKDGGNIRRGDVGGEVEKPPVAITKFLGEIVLLEGELRKDEILGLRCGTARVRCRVKELKERIDSETGEILESNPREIKENEAATVIIHTERVVMERFYDIPQCGRFILERGNRSIGAGVVLDFRKSFKHKTF
ncbi:MAG: GTP-binding protein [Candidatus Methanospirareceae archaeon]